MPALIAHVVTPGDGFVGRDQERLDIRLVLDRAATGTGGIVLLAGTPGIGASRLAAEVSGEASRKGWIVLGGRCAEQEEAPYAPFREVLAGAIAASPQRPLQELAAASGAMLAELVPSLRAKVRGTTLGSNDTSDGGRESLFKAVFDLLVASQGAKPLLVVLDDLQWADEATVLLLRDLAERLGNSKIVVLGTYWESDLDPERPFTGVVARLLRRRRAQRIALGRLTDAEVEKMLMSLAGGRDRRRAIPRKTWSWRRACAASSAAASSGSASLRTACSSRPQ
ncbi:MAG: ATP-binding protein [Chloroflexi bacterium]|nr:MAG: ATP-binding protein [Chloroflexota bacterium]